MSRPLRQLDLRLLAQRGAESKSVARYVREQYEDDVSSHGGARERLRACLRPGEWARLFRRADGYLGTELLRRSDNQGEYLTLDRWTSRPSYEAFRSRWSDEYGRLDRRLEGLTEEEAPLGSFEMLP